MNKSKSFKFFIRLLLLTIVTIIGVGISILLTSSGTGGAIAGGLFVVINVFFLLFSLIFAIINLFKHIFDKEKDHFDVLYVINVIFAGIVTSIFLVFYVMILSALFIVLLPFM